MDEMEWASLFDMAPTPAPTPQTPVSVVPDEEPMMYLDELIVEYTPPPTIPRPAPPLPPVKPALVVASTEGVGLWDLLDEEVLQTFSRPVLAPALPTAVKVEVLPPPILAEADDEDGGIWGDSGGDETPPFFQGLLIGSAGTGKTTLLKERIKENPKYGLLAATTGIAAVNLSSEDCTVRTMHSVLGFYDLNSLKQNYQRGRLTSKLMEVSSKGVNRLIVDEMSMLPDTMFEIILQALKEVNNYQTVIDRGGLGLMLVGDFLQLPPVEGKYVFESDKFSPFEREDNIEKLTKIWRQVDTDFLEALQCARQGDGAKMVDILYHHPDIKFANQLDDEFEGTTIVGTNQEVDRINFIRLQGLRQAGKKTLAVKSTRWGKEDSSWKNIPPEVELSIDGYVMILTNGGEGAYANGSCGWVREFTAGGKVWIELHEPKTAAKSAEIGLITRKCFDKHSVEKYGPLPEEKATWTEYKSDASLKMKYGPGKVGYVAYCAALTKQYRVEGNKPYYDFDEEMMVVGEIQYLPVRLAYATTVHKCLHPRSTYVIGKGATTEGPIPIGMVRVDDWLYTGSGYGRVSAVAHSYYSSWLKIRLKTGESIECSHDHVFPALLQFPKPGGRVLMIKAKELLEGYHLNTSDRTGQTDDWAQIYKIETVYSEYTVPFVDLTIDTDEHLFWANGIITHNSQGLSLDRCQIDYIGSGRGKNFFGSAGMSYVALSRVRTPQGLRIVGTPQDVDKKTNVLRKVLRWA